MRAGGHDDMAGVPGIGIGDDTEPRGSRPTPGGDLQNGGCGMTGAWKEAAYRSRCWISSAELR
jgi:hypothetical protein